MVVPPKKKLRARALVTSRTSGWPRESLNLEPQPLIQATPTNTSLDHLDVPLKMHNVLFYLFSFALSVISVNSQTITTTNAYVQLVLAPKSQ